MTKENVMDIETVCEEAYDRFGLNLVPSEEFDGHPGGIWVRDNIAKESTDWYNYWEGTLDHDNVLNVFMRERGFFAEPYDNETIFFWRI